MPFDAAAMWRRLTDTADLDGYAIQYVGAERGSPPWAYTLGRIADGLPELVIFGLDPQSSFDMIRALVDEWDELDLADDGMCRFPGPHDHRVALLPMPLWCWEIGDHLLGAQRFAAERGLLASRSAMQIVWPGDDGRFPWERGSAPSLRRRQPLLGMRRAA